MSSPKEAYDRASEVITACTDLLRPESGWTRFMVPELEKLVEHITTDILEGQLNDMEYHTNCELRILLLDILSIPEKALTANRAILTKKGPTA